MHAVHCHVIPEITVAYGGVGDAGPESQVMIDSQPVTEVADTHQAVETVVLDQLGLKHIGDEHLVPAFSRIVVLDESLYLVGVEMSPSP